MDDQICRLCGDIKSSQNIKSTIMDMDIRSNLEALSINLEKVEYLPNSVCLECTNMLELFSKFTQKILEVQDRLKNEQHEQLVELSTEEFEHFELKIERLDSVKVRRKSIKPVERNRGIKMRREVLKYTMQDLFHNELTKGQFTSETEHCLNQIKPEDLKNIGWFNYEWKCNGCLKIFSNVLDLEKHSMKCIRKRCINNCVLCHKEFPSYSTFLNHIVERHQPLLKYSCIICSEFHFNFVELFKHITSIHAEYSVLFCLYCGKVFFTGALLRDHITIHKPELELPEFSCDICGIRTHRKQILLSHMSRFHLERRFTCEWCAFSFKYRAELVQHQQSQHNDECNEECRVCLKRFKNKRKLRRHIRNMHESSGEVFSCEHCGKESKNRKAHKTHMKVN